MRYLAQRIGSWAWLNIDLKFETGGPEFTDTSYGVMSGTITPDLGTKNAADGRLIIEEGGTLIHVESTYARHWTGIVWSVVPEGGRLRVTVREWLGYLDGLPFQGKIWGVKSDPADLARTLLAHVQSFPNGKLGMSVTGSTPVRLGTDSSDKAIAARAKMKAAKATLDARTKTRQKKDAEIQAASKPFATALKTLEAARKAQADLVASMSKTQAGKTVPLRYPFSTSTVTQWPSSSHNGTDFGIAQGTPVPATVDGVVVLTGDDGNGAWCVHIRRSDGLIVQHGHLSRIDAKSGQIVNSSTRIGLSGGQPGTPGAGMSTGPHLHWELRWDTVWTGSVVDPRSLGPAQPGGTPAPGGAALEAAKKVLAQRQAAVDAKKAQRDSAVAPLRAQLDALKLAEEQARAPYEAAQTASQKADEKEREDGGAYRVLASDHPDCWRVLKDLCEAAGMGFTTHTERTRGEPKVELRIAYPARNVYRDDLKFVEGINVVSELQPAARAGYATEVLVLGAGEGDASIKASAAAADPRLRKLAVIEDKRVTTAAKAGQVARAELATRLSDIAVEEITVIQHAFAPMWSWQVGDVILLQGRGSGPEAYAQKHRIASWQMQGDTKAVLRLEKEYLMVDRETLALARQLRDLQISTQGQARTAQISRSSLPLVEYGVDEAGEPTVTDTEVMVGELLAQVPDISETVDGHDEQIGVIDETTSETVISVVDVLEWGSQQAEETHQVQLQVIETWEHAADMQVAHEILVETAAELDTKLGEAHADIEAAKGRLTGAETRLTATEARLTTAETGIADAKATAAGKNRIRSGLTDPPTDNPGGAIGDKYEKRNADGALLAAWSWEGDPAAWVSVPMSESYLPLVNIGDGTYGELSGDRMQAKSIGADQIDAQAIAALTAEISEAFIRTAHVLDLDVGKLIVTDGAEIDEAVIEKLWADVVKARLLVATEGIIAGSAVIDGTLLAKHMATEFFEGQHLKGVLVEGGKFVGATYELQATGTWSTIYNPGAVTSGTLSDFHGGSPDAVASAVLASGSARVSAAAAGQIVGYWTNPGAIDPVGPASRRVSIRVRSSQAMSGVHIMIGDKLVTGPAIPANTWTVMRIELAAGDRIDWIHVAGTVGAAATLDMDTVLVESAALAGAKLVVSHVDGVPGFRVLTASGATILDLSPLGLTSTSVDGAEQARLQYGQLSFTGGGETVVYDRNGIDNPVGVHAITSPGGILLDGPVAYGGDTPWANLPISSGFVVYSSQTPQWRVRRGRLLLRGAIAPSSGSFTTSYSTICPAGAIPALPGMRNSWTTARLVPSGSGQPAGRMYQSGTGELLVATTGGTAPYYLLNSEYDLEI